jgi:hypothetical protein
MPRSPHGLHDLGMGEDLAGVADKEPQQRVLRPGQLDRLAVDPDDAGGQIHRQRPAGKNGLLGGGLGMALGHLQAGQQFGRAERLGQVVVGPAAQSGHLVVLAVPHGQDDDGNRTPLAQPQDDIHSVHVGQAQVQHHEVGMARGHFFQAELPVGRFIDLVAIGLKSNSAAAGEAAPHRQ